MFRTSLHNDFGLACDSPMQGFIDPVRSTDSIRVGLDVHLASGVRKDNSGRLYNHFFNPRTQAMEWVPSDKAAQSYVSSIEQLDRADMKRIPALNGKEGIVNVRKEDVDYFLVDQNRSYSLGSNLVPGKSGIMNNRLHMGGKYAGQSSPLVEREAPLVRATNHSGSDASIETSVGRKLGNRYAPVNGTVVAVKDDKIVLQDADGAKHEVELYHNFPANNKGFLHNTPKVQKGDQVKEGDLLAPSNYTSDDGTAAMGINLRVASMPYYGYNFEDGIVISDAAARRMRSEQFSKHRITMTGNPCAMLLFCNVRQVFAAADVGIQLNAW